MVGIGLHLGHQNAIHTGKFAAFSYLKVRGVAFFLKPEPCLAGDWILTPCSAKISLQRSHRFTTQSAVTPVYYSISGHTGLLLNQRSHRFTTQSAVTPVYYSINDSEII